MILVVDDDPNIRVVLVRLLKTEGYEGQSVATGVEALQFLREHRPGCVILDVHMPGLSGFEVLKQIRSDSSYDDVRIIMCTSADRDVEREALALGATAFVQKCSLDWVKFAEVIEQHCSEGKRKAVHPPQPRVEDKQTG